MNSRSLQPLADFWIRLMSHTKMQTDGLLLRWPPGALSIHETGSVSRCKGRDDSH
jgi:hypothetical protein